MKVTPYSKSPLDQDYRTFEIFNPAPDSPICSIDINVTPLPAEPRRFGIVDFEYNKRHRRRRNLAWAAPQVTGKLPVQALKGGVNTLGDSIFTSP